MNSIEICNCRCHLDDHVRHVVPCCAPCPICTQRIKHFARDTHVDECAATARKRLEALWTDQRRRDVKFELMANASARRTLQQLLGHQSRHVSAILAHLTDDKEEFDKLVQLMDDDRT